MQSLGLVDRWIHSFDDWSRSELSKRDFYFAGFQTSNVCGAQQREAPLPRIKASGRASWRRRV